MKTHPFDGEQLTVQQIHQRVPALSERSICRALAAGRNTKQSMLSFDPRQAYRAAGKKSKASPKSRGWGFA